MRQIYLILYEDIEQALLKRIYAAHLMLIEGVFENQVSEIEDDMTLS
jgi:hypothetical protein